MENKKIVTVQMTEAFYNKVMVDVPTEGGGSEVDLDDMIYIAAHYQMAVINFSSEVATESFSFIAKQDGFDKEGDFNIANGKSYTYGNLALTPNPQNFEVDVIADGNVVVSKRKEQSVYSSHVGYMTVNEALTVEASNIYLVLRYATGHSYRVWLKRDGNWL